MARNVGAADGPGPRAGARVKGGARGALSPPPPLPPALVTRSPGFPPLPLEAGFASRRSAVTARAEQHTHSRQGGVRERPSSGSRLRERAPAAWDGARQLAGGRDCRAGIHTETAAAPARESAAAERGAAAPAARE
ncbi:hypothetical protein NDU88_001668 [Pleurodeles waltl]|uniref:Uncharacterized protein n=1 Tax=Pleurodeles waltl TaxID=8319 RepID=A0AAV7Q4Q0_PLEWA|nr:hypothetical protein NDU88_001668 [Pleurodeles waltl]